MKLIYYFSFNLFFLFCSCTQTNSAQYSEQLVSNLKGQVLLPKVIDFLVRDEKIGFSNAVNENRFDRKSVGAFKGSNENGASSFFFLDSYYSIDRINTTDSDKSIWFMKSWLGGLRELFIFNSDASSNLARLPINDMYGQIEIIKNPNLDLIRITHDGRYYGYVTEQILIVSGRDFKEIFKKTTQELSFQSNGQVLRSLKNIIFSDVNKDGFLDINENIHEDFVDISEATNWHIQISNIKILRRQIAKSKNYMWDEKSRLFIDSSN